MRETVGTIQQLSERCARLTKERDLALNKVRERTRELEEMEGLLSAIEDALRSAGVAPSIEGVRTLAQRASSPAWYQPTKRPDGT